MAWHDASFELHDFLEYRMKKSNFSNIVSPSTLYHHQHQPNAFILCIDVKTWTKINKRKLQATFSTSSINRAESAPKRKFFFANLNRKKLALPKTFWHYAAETGQSQVDDIFKGSGINSEAGTAIFQLIPCMTHIGNTDCQTIPHKNWFIWHEKCLFQIKISRWITSTYTNKLHLFLF